jgi:hypothetical protein
MAHILIGLYHSLAEAEGIVHELVEQGFARPCITLATFHATISAPEHLGLQTWSTLEGEQGLRRRFLDLGVPDSEVHTYTEAVRQGDTLVVVQASAEQAERGLDILHGPPDGSAPLAVPGPCGGDLPWRPYAAYCARESGHAGLSPRRDRLPPTSGGDGAGERPDLPGVRARVPLWL